MLSWELYFTPDRMSYIDRDFDIEYNQIILKLPFSDKVFDIDVAFDAYLQHLSLTSLNEEQSIKVSSHGTADGSEPTIGKPREESENEELPYDELTSTEMLILKWNTCPVPGRIYFYHRWDSPTTDDAFETEDNQQDTFVKVHLHKAKCKAKTLVKAMQETRRMALPRNFRKIYFGNRRVKGKRKAQPNGNDFVGNKL